jgi:uncharacterized repeat protein (TIGR03847 family)
MSMSRPRHNMGRVAWIGVEAVGVPGQRTFRLLVQNADFGGYLWLEKEQLQALAEGIARMMLEIDSEKGFDIPSRQPDAANPKPAGFPASPDFEIYVGALSLKYDSVTEMIALEAFSRDEDEEEGPPTFHCLATREQMETLQVNSMDVVNAGRPKCPLCGTPLPAAGVPHFCPPTNGHQKLTEDD